MADRALVVLVIVCSQPLPPQLQLTDINPALCTPDLLSKRMSKLARTPSLPCSLCVLGAVALDAIRTQFVPARGFEPLIAVGLFCRTWCPPVHSGQGLHTRIRARRSRPGPQIAVNVSCLQRRVVPTTICLPLPGCAFRRLRVAPAAVALGWDKRRSLVVLLPQRALATCHADISHGDQPDPTRTALWC